MAGILDTGYTDLPTSGGVLPNPNWRVDSAFSQLPNWQQPPMTLEDLIRMQAQQGGQQPPGPQMQGGMPVSMPRDEELNARPQPQQTIQQPQGMPGIGDRLNAGLMGFANAGAPIPAIANLISGLMTGQRSDAAGVQQQAQLETYKALVQSGVPVAQARAAALNPEILKQIAPEHFGGFKVVQTGEDALGNKIFSLQGPGGKFHPINVEGQAGGGVSGMSSGVLAKGVTQFDNSLVGQEYLNQFSPEIQAAVKAYVEGRSMPTGNPRKGFTQFVKQVAQKYGGDINMPADDAAFAARRTMLNDLQKTTPGSAGGQITFARTSIRHLDEVAKAAEALNNKDLGFTWGTQAINNLRGLSTAQAAKISALQDAAQHYGQEVTKFYAGSPGGEAERQRFLTALNGAKSPQELAAVIAQEKALIPERLSELQNRIQGTLGPLAEKYPVHSKESEESLRSIDATVARMRGLAPAAAPPVTPSVPGQWQTLPNGARIRQM
jgi:hypothetical protein